MHSLHENLFFGIFEALEMRLFAAIVKRVLMDLGSIMYFRRDSLRRRLG
jgi:hypothetical protein